MLTHFDHVTAAVNDLSAASAAYGRLLGRGPTWRGVHPELGTESALFGLENALIELVGPRAEALESEGLRTWLDAHGEGLQAIAFGTEDAASCSAQLRASGLRATPPQLGEAVGADGLARRYQSVELSPRSTRGLHVLAVQRSDTQALRAADALPSSSAHALDHVVIRTADPEAAIACYGTGLGIRLALDRVLGQTRMLFFRVGQVTIEVVQDKTLDASDTLYGLAYRVRDLDAAHARLLATEASVSPIRPGNKPSTRVFTVRDGTAGVPTLILHDPTRA